MYACGVELCQVLLRFNFYDFQNISIFVIWNIMKKR